MYPSIVKSVPQCSRGLIKAFWSDLMRFCKENIHIKNCINRNLKLLLAAVCTVTVKALLSLFCGYWYLFFVPCCTDLVYSFLLRLSSAPTHLQLVRWWRSGPNIRWKLRLCWWLTRCSACTATVTTTLFNEHDPHLFRSSFRPATIDECSQRASCVFCGQAYRWKAVLTMCLMCVDLCFVCFIKLI